MSRKPRNIFYKLYKNFQYFLFGTESETAIENYVGLKLLQKHFKPIFWFIFSASAKQHDEDYERGGDKMDKLTTDVGFFWRMLSDANKQETFSRKRLAVYIAIIYFLFVRVFGWIGFNYKKHGK